MIEILQIIIKYFLINIGASNSMRKIFFLSIFATVFLFGSLDVSAQLLNIYQIDTTSFPTIRAFYTVKDSYYQNYANLTKGDFTIKKDGQDIPFDLNCSQLNSQPAVSLSLMLDASVSMMEAVSPTELRHQWASYSASIFVDSLKFTPGTAVNLISFSGNIVKSTDWEDNKVKAKALLGQYVAGQTGATNLMKPFMETTIGSLDRLASRPATSKRVAVLLTDGGHEAGQKFLRDDIIDKARKNNIEIYVILLNAPQNVGADLDLIARETGGKLFRPNTKEGLDLIFLQIYTTIQNYFTCRLEWNEDYICAGSDRNREVEVTFNKSNPKMKQTVSYQVPISSVSKLSVSQSALYFSDGQDGMVSQDLTLMATNGDFKLTNYSITPNPQNFTIDWKGGTPLDAGGLVLKEGDVRTITIKYKGVNQVDEVLSKFKVFDAKCDIPPVDLIAPCGGITQNFQFTNLPQKKQIIILNKAFYNNSDREVIVNVSKVSDTDNVLNLVKGNSYVLEAKSYLNLEVEFNPIDNKPATASLQFSTIDGCSNPILVFSASIGNVRVITSPLNFGNVRVKTPKKAYLEIENHSDFTAVINDFDFNSKVFVIQDLKQNPITVASNKIEKVEVNYLADIEGDFSENISFKGIVPDNNNEAITLSAQITATSYLPNLETKAEVDFPKTALGASANPINLDLNNNSKLGDLKIEQIRFKQSTNSGDFFFEGNPSLNNLTVLTEGRMTLGLGFKPSKNGYQEAIIEVIADNVEGPDPVTNVITEIKVTGNTEQVDGLHFDDIDFGSQFVCDMPSKTVVIDNSASNKPITYSIIRDYKTSNFTIESIVDKVVNVGEKSSFVIIYSPENAGTHSESIKIRYSDGREGDFMVRGNSTKKDFRSTFAPRHYLVRPGNDIRFNFTSNFDSFSYGAIKTITYVLRFDPQFIRTSGNTFSTDLTNENWSWTVDKTEQNKGVIYITGKIENGILGIPKKVKNTVDFTAYLGDGNVSQIEVETLVDNNCMQIEKDTATFELEGCFIGGRVINFYTFGATQISPSPLDQDTEFKYSVGFECPTKIVLFDAVGSEIRTMFDGIQVPGEHSLPLKITDLSRGIYFINYKAGPYEKTVKFILN